MLIDEVLEAQFEKAKTLAFEKVRSSKVIDIQGLVDSIIIRGKPDLSSGFTDILPFIADIWFEWSEPCNCCDGKSHEPQRLGAHVHSSLIDSENRQQLNYLPISLRNKVRFSCVANLYGKGGDDELFRLSPYFWHVSNESQYIGAEPNLKKDATYSLEGIPHRHNDSVKKEFSWMDLVIWTMELINQSLVEVVRGDSIPSHLQKSRLREGKPTLMPWSTLSLERNRDSLEINLNGNGH